MIRARGFYCIVHVFAFAVLFCIPLETLRAQTESATISGVVTDSLGGVVVGARILLNNIDRGTSVIVTTNGNGLYVFPAVEPGQYRLSARKDGFKQVDVIGIIVNVQDRLEENFHLNPGSVAESVTVTGNPPLVNTTDASVSTVIDRKFAEDLPLNGRSFQTLIGLTPGVVFVPAGGEDSGQFSANGQRASANYWSVDGVSANVGSSTESGGNGAAGAVGLTSALGGTNSLVSVDAMQEFRIQTSTFAPEYGRTPGAQISIVTRSGTNQFHGSAFDYLRNDKFDANNWFNCYTNNPCLPKAEERQNDFGGTLGGPIRKGRTFFFFSYEGLRLRLPTTTLTLVPDAAARQSALPAVQPYLNAFPLDSSQPELGNGVAQFNASYSNPATLDAYSLRIDHRLTDKITLFGRYNHAPSQVEQRGASGEPLSSVSFSTINADQATVGMNWLVSANLANELRFNYSRTDASTVLSLDKFGGAVPVVPSFPSPYTTQSGAFGLFITPLGCCLFTGPSISNVQHQINFVDNISVQKGPHALKFGVDYRRLTPLSEPAAYSQFVEFLDVSSAANGNVLVSDANQSRASTLLFRNLGAFAQDTWRIMPRLTITYGLRWDIDFPPAATSCPGLPAIAGFQGLANLATISLAPPGTPAFKTSYTNLAPRIGVAYQLRTNLNWDTVIRGGGGIFYDLATAEAGNIAFQTAYPFHGPFNSQLGGSFPLSGSTALAPPIEPPSPANPQLLGVFDPNLKAPYTAQWNVAVEQSLGAQQSLSATYVGAVGRRLVQTSLLAEVPGSVALLNGGATGLDIATNGSTSDYHALQLQFNRRLSSSLQTLASYTWSHSIDTGSAGSLGVGSNLPSSDNGFNANRASSDFDIRNTFSGGLTYAIPSPRRHFFATEIIRGWSLQSIIQARSAPPIQIRDSNPSNLLNGFSPDIRPDVLPGIPFYLYGPQYPGRKAINNAVGAGTCADGSQSIGPFCPTPVDPITGDAIRQGTLSRNALRGFGATQWDFAVHREFPLREYVKLQFRAEMFNVLNHPNFGPPIGDIANSQFGLSTQMLAQSLAGPNLGSGGFSALYQIGGPRSVQFALKLTF
jgi:hypothetical protein